MWKLISILVAVTLLFAIDSEAATKISKAQIKEMFDAMSKDARWDVDEPLLWGYFFTNAEPNALERAAAELQSKGYRVVDISAREGAPALSLWWLHVEKAEKHTVDTLSARNQEFQAIAVRFGLGSYDGMDVGPVKK